MKLSPQQLGPALARGLLPVYVVAGDEPLLVQESLDAIRAAARRHGFEEREVLDVERGFDWSRLIEACRAMSLFAARRIVELRLPGGNPGAEGAEILKRLAAQPSPETLLIVACEALDARQRAAPWYGALETAGASVYGWPIGEAEFPRWLEGRLAAAGLSADADAIQALAEKTQGNALAAAQDVEKLKLLFPQGTIGLAQVQEAVADSARFTVFDLADRMLGGDAAGAARSLRRLREEGVEVLEILAGLSWMLRQWLQAQQIFARGGDASAACTQARIAHPRQAAMRRALPRTRLPQLYGWLRRCALIDEAAKRTGGQEQAWEELLTLVLAAAGAAPMRTR